MAEALAQFRKGLELLAGCRRADQSRRQNLISRSPWAWRSWPLKAGQRRKRGAPTPVHASSASRSAPPPSSGPCSMVNGCSTPCAPSTTRPACQWQMLQPRRGARGAMRTWWHTASAGPVHSGAATSRGPLALWSGRCPLRPGAAQLARVSLCPGSAGRGSVRLVLGALRVRGIRTQARSCSRAACENASALGHSNTWRMPCCSDASSPSSVVTPQRPTGLRGP